MKVLLDSNAYTHLAIGNQRVAEFVRRSEKILFSTIVAGELLYGFRHGSRFDANLRELGKFLESPQVELVPVAWTTSDRYSRIATSLRRKGRPIPTNDIWIAAQAMETGADLLSFDSHFDQVDGLAWVNCSVP
jgi:tRNA(fMet)-specific endonuclease VapC